MPKNTRSGMTRGTKLTKQHYSVPLTDVVARVNNVQLDRDNLTRPQGCARLNLHIPNMDSAYWSTASTPGQAVDFCVPFTLPPLQEFWNAQGQPGTTTPVVTLDEFTLAWDQRAEPAAISDSHGNGGQTGKIDYIDVTRLDISVAVVEKPQRIFGSQAYAPEREVFSAQIPQTAYAGASFRYNPFTLSDLGKTLAPYRTYLLVIRCPDLYSASGVNLCLPALTVSLKFLHPLVARDMGSNIQNIPNHQGGKNPPALSVTVPTAGSIINAQGNTGVQTGLNTVDQFFQQKVDGGYTWDANVPPVEAIYTDSTLDILMVPMWQNCPAEVNVLSAASLYDVATNQCLLPYCAPLTFTDPTCDRRIIPLPWPIAIHHVIAITNYADPTQNSFAPTSATCTNAVGVGLASICRNDLVAYEQVAYQDWTPISKNIVTIDQIKARAGGTLTREKFDYELMSVPLVGTGGAGYLPQGHPVFCGGSASLLTGRTDIDGHSPATQGREQHLEVRWLLSDPGGLQDTTNGGAAGLGDVYAGNGGNWVQIVGKKTACQAGGPALPHADLPR